MQVLRFGKSRHRNASVAIWLARVIVSLAPWVDPFSVAPIAALEGVATFMASPKK